MVMSTRSNTNEVLRELRWSSKGGVNSSLGFAVVGLRERLHPHICVLVLFKANMKKRYVEE